MSAVAPCASSSLFAGGTLAQRQWTTNAHRTRKISKVVKTNEPNRHRRGRASCVTSASMKGRGLQESYNGAGRTVLITGANSGVGLESSKQLVAAGW
jgi:hypothetical protein